MSMCECVCVICESLHKIVSIQMFEWRVVSRLPHAHVTAFYTIFFSMRLSLSLSLWICQIDRLNCFRTFRIFSINIRVWTMRNNRLFINIIHRMYTLFFIFFLLIKLFSSIVGIASFFIHSIVLMKISS